MSQSMHKSVSVVLATHNGARHIERQLESISKQTFSPCELIISDDASTDSTVAIAQGASAHFDFPVNLYRNAQAKGFRDNFLHASLHAQGDFIAFCDQDDVWHPTKLEKCSQYFEDKDVSLIAHSARLIDAEGAPMGRFGQGIKGNRIRPPLSYDPWETFWGFSMVFRRELLSLADVDRRFIDFIVPTELIAHDRWIMFLGQMVGSVAEIDEPLVDYRQHAANLFGASTKRDSSHNISWRSKNYIQATAQMIRVLEAIPHDAGETFPLFQRDRCFEFLTSALQQLQSRHKIYEAPTRIDAVYRLFECVSNLQYRGMHDRSLRWKSLLRDAKFALLRV